MTRNLQGRVAKLEQYRKPHRQYVFHVSDPPTMEEEAAIANAFGPIVVVPHSCKTVAAWIAKYSPMGALQ